MIGIGVGINKKLFGSGVPPFVGLLDEYSSNALAFSIRRLYSGSTYAFNVRRTNNDQLDIGFTAEGDLDIITLLTFCGSGDGFITKWYDQGNLGIQVENGGAENQPKIVSAGVLNTDNGKPAILFNSKFLISAFFANVSQPITHFSVTNVPNTGINMFDGQYDDAFSVVRSYFQNSQLVIAGGGVIGTNSQYLHDDQNLIYFLANSGGNEYQVNNNTKITNTTTSSGGLSRLIIGAAGGTGYRANGNFQEAIYFRSNMSSSANAIRTNMNNYYGIY